MYMFGYAPEELEVDEQLELTRQHAIEWRTMLALETEFRRALKIRHRYEYQQAISIKISFDEPSMMNRHRQEMMELERKHKQEQEFIRRCQAEEKADLQARSQKSEEFASYR